MVRRSSFALSNPIDTRIQHMRISIELDEYALAEKARLVRAFVIREADGESIRVREIIEGGRARLNT